MERDHIPCKPLESPDSTQDSSLEATYLYRHYDNNWKLLYVGISLNALGRLHRHSRFSPWFDRIASVTVERFNTREEAMEAEYKAVNDENPECNIALREIPADEIGPLVKRKIAQAYDSIAANVTIQPLYTIQEAAKLLKTSTTSIYSLINNNQLGHVRINSKKLVSGWQILDYLEVLHRHDKDRETK